MARQPHSLPFSVRRSDSVGMGSGSFTPAVAGSIPAFVTHEHAAFRTASRLAEQWRTKGFEGCSTRVVVCSLRHDMHLASVVQRLQRLPSKQMMRVQLPSLARSL